MGWNYTKSIILGLGIGSLVLLLTPNMSSNWLPRFFSVARAPEGYANAIERSAESVVGIRVSLRPSGWLRPKNRRRRFKD